MQIWLETTQNRRYFDDTPDSECDCVTPTYVTSCLQPLLWANEVEYISLFPLRQSSPLYIQECTPEHWAVCNPTGNGRIVVLDAEALQLFQHFQHACTLQDLWPALAGKTTNQAMQVITLLYQAGLLRNPGTSMQKNENETDSVLTAWLHITNA